MCRDSITMTVRRRPPPPSGTHASCNMCIQHHLRWRGKQAPRCFSLFHSKTPWYWTRGGADDDNERRRRTINRQRRHVFFGCLSKVDCFSFLMVGAFVFKKNQPSTPCVLDSAITGWLPPLFSNTTTINLQHAYFGCLSMFRFISTSTLQVFFFFDGCHLCFRTKTKKSTFNINMPSFWMPVDESILLASSELAISSSIFAAAAIYSLVPVPPSRTTLLLALMSDSWLYDRTLHRQRCTLASITILSC